MAPMDQEDAPSLISELCRALNTSLTSLGREETKRKKKSNLTLVVVEY